MQTQKEITVGQIWEEVDPRLIRKVRVVEVASLEGPKGILIENVESGRGRLRKRKIKHAKPVAAVAMA